VSPAVGRRALLVGLAGLAGCSGEARVASPESTATESTAADEGGSTPSGELDLREANVVGVETSAADDGVRFSVTLLHDDEGEEGYADWWQVDSLDGERLGRRALSHPHGTREFTRSTTVAVPEGVDCVVVRGHDQTHGYGGQAALVALDGTDATVALRRQGSEPTAFGAGDCP